MFKMFREDTTEINPPKVFNVMLDMDGRTSKLTEVTGLDAAAAAVAHYALAFKRRVHPRLRIYTEVAA